jgi:putative membrane protein
MIYKMAPIGVLVLAFARVAGAQDAATLLNQANQINYQEIETAKTAKSKAGDNQALKTYADTIKGDHQANEDAVTALSRQKSIKLNGTNPDNGEKSKLNDLSGGAFNQAYLDDQISGHKHAIETFKAAASSFKGDPDTELYIQQTLPVLEAHLTMAKNLRHHLSTTAAENPFNNKSNTDGMGQSTPVPEAH